MTTRATLPTDISPPHTPILCNVRVAWRMGPRGVHSCSTCYLICLGRTKTVTIRLLSLTLTSGMPFRKCAVRLPLTHSWVSLRRPTTVDGSNLVTRSPPLTSSSLSWVTSGPVRAMHSTECTNRFTDHCGRTHHVTGTTGGQQGDGMEMGRYSLSQHPIWGRVLARHRRARGG
jgi:hypothetical protein